MNYIHVIHPLGQPSSVEKCSCTFLLCATLITDYGDQVSLMYQQTDQSYVGRNEKLSEQNGVFTLQWGYEAPLQRCVAR